MAEMVRGGAVSEGRGAEASVVRALNLTLPRRRCSAEPRHVHLPVRWSQPWRRSACWSNPRGMTRGSARPDPQLERRRSLERAH